MFGGIFYTSVVEAVCGDTGGSRRACGTHSRLRKRTHRAIHYIFSHNKRSWDLVTVIIGGEGESLFQWELSLYLRCSKAARR